MHIGQMTPARDPKQKKIQFNVIKIIKKNIFTLIILPTVGVLGDLWGSPGFLGNALPGVIKLRMCSQLLEIS